jgi:hypothetical protein
MTPTCLGFFPRADPGPFSKAPKVDGKVTICHASRSGRHAYQVLRVSQDACIDAFSPNEGDYVAVGDPTCSGEGCLPAAEVAALVIQRLVDPNSKLAATAWFPRSALPELLDVAPSRFNNTRIHRVLDLLDAAGPRGAV